MNDEVRSLCDQFDEIWSQLEKVWKVNTLPRRGKDGLTHAMALTRLGRELVNALRDEVRKGDSVPVCWLDCQVDDDPQLQDFSQFDEVTEYEDFAPCEVMAVENGMITIFFDGDDTELYKFPPSVTNSDFHNPITHEVVTADQAQPGFICRSLYLKIGVGELLGLI